MAETQVDLVELDKHLSDVVKSVQAGVTWGMSHRDDPEALKKALADCKEVIDEVMDASVLSW